ncbi:TonB-dependent receptor [Novosphingobium sp. KN65.2]|uniref:TonB-dependent receptor domain-containing protein n=1 Tax=Novosphingobium sp. KN65.2 TaxID=1478134 RepID=UPI0005DCBC8A|nr:TonB-dependent receptor [Novosphingobium sp. KN65.2]CDO36587.1 putative TonB-dependent receptor [Novosphingobium sp. KN65.2]
MGMRRFAIWCSSWACASAATLAPGAWSPPAEAREAARHGIDISASDLPTAIAELARETRVSIGTQGTLPKIRTRRLRGDYSVSEALAQLLAGSGFVARQVSETAWRIDRAPTAPTPDPLPPPAPSPPPEPIVVTTTKQPLELLSLPAAVSVVGLQDDLHGNPARSSAMVASQIEGLSLTSLGPGRNRMFLRGVADSAFSGESQSTVAVVFDEARLTYAAPDPDIRLVDMDRVEVLKGPQGSLYGTGALGGIYRMVSRAPELDRTSLDVSAGTSLVMHGDTGYSGSAVANLPLVNEMAALRLVGYAAKEPGWIDTGSRNDANWTRVSGARAGLAFVPTADWRLDLTGFGQWLRSSDTRYVYTSGSYTRDAQSPEPHDNDLIHFAGRLNGTLGTIDMTVASAMTWHDVDNTLDATVGAEDFGLDDPQSLHDKRHFRIWDSELRLRGHLGGVTWLAGISRLVARQKLATSLENIAGAMATLDDDRRTSHDNAAYFDATIPVTGTVSIDAGARLFRSSIRETRMLPTGPVSRERDKSGITPSLALSWQPNSSSLLYVRYGSAFRQGGSDITSSGSIDALGSDELASVELGWRQRLSGGGKLDLGAWFSHWHDLQSDVLEDNGLVETTNAGNARIFGIEGSLELPLAEGWQVEAGGNFTDARLYRNNLGYKLEDRHLPVVPEYTVRAGLRHDFTLGLLNARARLNLRYVGPARMSFDPDLDRKMGDLIESEFEVQITDGIWQVSLSVQNLFADKGDVFAFGNALRYRTMPQFTPQQPTTLSVNGSIHF